jgi:hypothetical protein
MTRKKRERKNRRNRNPEAALWELLPDELVRRIVGFVRQRFMIGVHPTPVHGTRLLSCFKSTRLLSRAFADGLHSIVLLSVPPYHPDHVDAFAEGLVRLACDLFNRAQQEELGNAHVSFKCDFLKDRLGQPADHLPALKEIVKRAWFQSKPPIFFSDYRNAACMHLGMLVPTGDLVLPTATAEKQRMVAFLANAVAPAGMSGKSSLEVAKAMITLAMQEAVAPVAPPAN